ncbi:SDR family NAD(P)-dependent oxidoreductase [Morganella psychrotolerans]|uniref:SDR family NAD(P)-dependent oxidoreductase n=1 Tax=Morganella psychrotolerans TaxID=368603 RepID=UPI0039AFDBBF
MNPQQRTAVITDAETCLGKQLTRTLLDEHYRVIGIFSNEQAMQDFMQGPDNKPSFLPIVGDSHSADFANEIIQQGIIHFGNIDVIIHNSGAFISKSFETTTTDDLQYLINSNIYSLFNLSQLAIKNMLKNEGGKIIVVTSSIALQPSQKIPAAMSVLVKEGVHGLVRALALEYAKKNIRINAIAPGYIESPTCAGLNKDLINLVSPADKVGTIKDIIDSIRFLLTSDYINGTIMPVDGGYSAGNW